MAASIAVEEERGLFVRHMHPHNGYYAGHFPGPRYVGPAAWQAPIAPFDPEPS
jgi:hypothetical protein